MVSKPQELNTAGLFYSQPGFIYSSFLRRRRRKMALSCSRENSVQVFHELCKQAKLKQKQNFLLLAFRTYKPDRGANTFNIIKVLGVLVIGQFQKVSSSQFLRRPLWFVVWKNRLHNRNMNRVSPKKHRYKHQDSRNRSGVNRKLAGEWNHFTHIETNSESRNGESTSGKALWVWNTVGYFIKVVLVWACHYA